MMTDNSLPPSLAAKPNIPWAEQTVEQLKAERDHWKQQIDAATGWGGGLGQSLNYHRACEQWIERREREVSTARETKLRALYRAHRAYVDAPLGDQSDIIPTTRYDLRELYEAYVDGRVPLPA